MKYLPALMVNLHADDNQDSLIIPILRQLACVLLLTRFHVHTDDTLALLQGHIDKFDELAKVCRFFLGFCDTFDTCYITTGIA